MCQSPGPLWPGFSLLLGGVSGYPPQGVCGELTLSVLALVAVMGDHPSTIWQEV